ncbi:MAG: hypothetical protein EA359_14765 [Balneolaceae bacterium]|nr:MAG: hypothetical protein EA359_14765 [Balneolaceae bacterium]
MNESAFGLNLIRGDYTGFFTISVKEIILLSLFFFLSAQLSAQTATAPGNASDPDAGTVTNPYQIANLNNLYWIAATDAVVSSPDRAARWAAHYIQTADIDASATSGWFSNEGWSPIGNSTLAFTGTYDGQHNSISNLFINRPSSNEIGLFGKIDGQSTQKVVIQNLSLVNVNITGNREIGALVGLADQFNDIINCHVSGSVKGNNNTGGLVGWGRRTDFLRCSSSANVEVNTTAVLYHGGLIGHINTTSTVRESFATGNVSGRGRVGGLIGAIGWNSLVENSYATGSVKSNVANPMIGGLIGEVWNARVRKSYSTGEIIMTGITSDYGGLVGNKTTDNNFGDEDNFWDTQTSGLSVSEMGTGKTTSEMKNVATFTSTATTGLTNPWDFVGNPNDDTGSDNIWNIDPAVNDGYPFLTWQSFDTPVVYYSRQNGNWDVATTWSTTSCGGSAATNSPGNGDNVILCDGHIVSVTTQITNESSITVQTGGELHVNSVGILTTEGSISSSGEIRIRSGGLFNNQTGTPVDIIAERDLVTAGWSYLSSPVSDVNLGDFLSPVWTQGLTGNSGSGNSEFGDPNVFRWDNSFDENEPSGWDAVLDLNSTMEPAEGFLVAVFEASEFGGSADLPHELSVAGTEHADVSITTNNQVGGWTFIGNPYATAISFDELRGTTGITDAVYVWTPGGGGDQATDEENYDEPFEAGSWATYTVSSGAGNLTGGLIAPFQAFFVENESGSSIGLTFNNDVKSSDTPTDWFKQAPRDVIRLELAGQGMSNSAWLSFSQSGTTDQRISGDAWQLEPMSSDYALLATIRWKASYLYPW